MECREFQITLVSAQNLENVRQFFRNRVRVYAKVSLGGNPRTEKKTPEDKKGQTNPVWNFTATYTIGKNAVKSQDIKLLIQLYCIRTSRDTNIGEVSVSLKELFDRFSTLPQGEGTATVIYPVKKGGVDSQGELSFSYKFGDIFPFDPPSMDWSKLCWKGTKFIFKGGVLCIRLTLLASGNIFDVPIDAVADIAYTSFDILNQIFGSGGDLIADIPWGTETDLLVDVSCPGADVPMVVDTTSSLQTNVYEGSDVPTHSTNVFARSNMPADILYIPCSGIELSVDVTSCVGTNMPTNVSCVGASVPTAMDATSVVQTDAFGGSNVQVDSTNLYAESNVPTDGTSAVTNLLADLLYIPSARREAPADATSWVATNVPADVPFSGADVPTVVDATSSEVSMDATFSSETIVTDDTSCLKAVVRVK